MKYYRKGSEIVGCNGEIYSKYDLSPTGDSLLRVLQKYPSASDDPLKQNLPFQPLSYRDLMLSEEHYYNSASGMAQVYYPFTSKIGKLYSAMTGWKFPAFNPPALWYKQPIFYQSNHLAIYADGSPIHCPTYCDYLDVELELGVILGSPIFNASVEEATAAIAGFCVLNDFSARNVQIAEMSSGFGPQHSKSFANSISSVVVTAGEILPKVADLAGRIILNGRLVRECKPGKWKFNLGEAISHISKGTRLHAGELIGTGTWPGGTGIEQARFRLQVGDNVGLEIDGIGSIDNEIVAEEYFDVA
ncbi:hypothetical protein BGZ63DRAFT_434998 [Mariannaea sp. PMI_226]|nr:hypothetical protein BGZ63DRAFT_434998 [Mariannaea sp. PMI_226]